MGTLYICMMASPIQVSLWRVRHKNHIFSDSLSLSLAGSPLRDNVTNNSSHVTLHIVFLIYIFFFIVSYE